MPLRPHLHLATVDSTSDELRRRVDAGTATAGTVLTASMQTAGRGRRGRSWSTAPDQSIAMSVLLTLDAPDDGMALTILGGLAIARVAREAGVIDVRLKWPNDVLVRGRKLAGVLVDAHRADARTWAILGLGVNVEQPEGTLPETPLGPAISLQAAGATIDTPAATRALIRALDHELDRLSRDGRAPLIEDWLNGLGLRNQTVWLETPEGTRHGTLDGADEAFTLALRDADGHRQRIPAAHVRSLRAEPPPR